VVGAPYPGMDLQLTTAEWRVVIDAIAYYETVLEDSQPRRVATLGRAWRKLQAAR